MVPPARVFGFSAFVCGFWYTSSAARKDIGQRFYFEQKFWWVPRHASVALSSPLRSRFELLLKRGVVFTSGVVRSHYYLRPHAEATSPRSAPAMYLWCAPFDHSQKCEYISIRAERQWRRGQQSRRHPRVWRNRAFCRCCCWRHDLLRLSCTFEPQTVSTGYLGVWQVRGGSLSGCQLLAAGRRLTPSLNYCNCTIYIEYKIWSLHCLWQRTLLFQEDPRRPSLPAWLVLESGQFH